MRRGLTRGIGVLVVALVLVLAGLAAWWLRYRPVVVAGSAAPAGPFVLPPPAPGLRLHVFTTGMNRMGAVLVGAQRPWRPASAFVIEHPGEGLVVFDCGLSDAVARDGEAALGIPMRWLFESRGRPGRTLAAQMREADLDPGRVRWVVLSHWHDDHVGGAPAFPNATFVGGPGSAAWPVAPGFAPTRRTVDFAAAAPLPPFDAALDFFGDGSLWILRGGGHTREDLLVLLPLPDGPVLLAGDAVVHRDWLASDDVQRIAVDPERAADVRNRIRALMTALPRLVLVPGHDLGGVPHDRDDVVWHHPELTDPVAWPIGPSPRGPS